MGGVSGMVSFPSPPVKSGLEWDVVRPSVLILYLCHWRSFLPEFLVDQSQSVESREQVLRSQWRSVHQENCRGLLGVIVFGVGIVRTRTPSNKSWPEAGKGQDSREVSPVR